VARRIGILTGGGDAPGLNAVIRAVVKTAITSYGLEVIGIEDGYEGLLTDPPRARPLTLDSVRGVLPLGGTILGSTNRLNPAVCHCEWEPSSPEVRSCYDVAVENIRRLELDALVVLGGDGTLAMAHRMAQRGAPIIGVPKTIDNDVAVTDVTFGFDTAVTIATEAIDRLHTTAEAHHRVMIVEVMGRHAGWIALYAGVAGGADIILIPEIPFDLDAILRTIEARYEHGRRFTLIALAEGARPAGGEAVYQTAPGAAGPRRLGGIGAWLEAALCERSPREVRVTVLGHLQRGGGPTAADRLLATRFGCQAAHLAAAGRTGVMVAYRAGRMQPVDLEEVTRAPKGVDPDGEIVRAARGMGIGFG
jgi:6-phosphofructokinase 1